MSDDSALPQFLGKWAVPAGVVAIVLLMAGIVLTAPTTHAVAAPAPVTASSSRGPAVTEVAAGGSHTCVLREDGHVQCWGNGAQGRLGYGNTESIGDDEHPSVAGSVNLGAGRSAVAIAAGASHTCAILDDGTVRCWGAGFLGQLGHGNTQDIGDNETPADVGPITLTRPFRTAVAITARADHSCALLDDGSVVCWGSGTFGRLGYGNTQNIGDNETPADAGAVRLGGRAVLVTAGLFHTCALLDEGEMRCWGFGQAGALGYGNKEHIGDDETPASVPPVLVAEATSVSAGGSHTCVIIPRRRRDDLTRCWGAGEFGQLGYGKSETIGDDETPATTGEMNLGGAPKAFALGRFHTCGLNHDASVRCWGRGDFGQLGNGRPRDIGDDEPVTTGGLVDLGPGRTATMVSAGFLHTCAVLDDGNVRCWGAGGNGRLGYSSTKNIGDNETPASAGPVQLLSLQFDAAPTAVADAATVAQNDPATAIDVLANDTDTDGGFKAVESVTQPANGTVVITGAGSGLTYAPSAGYCNTAADEPADEFRYTLNRGSTALVSVTVTCAVTEVPDPVDEVPDPVDEVPDPVDEVPDPVDEVPDPVDLAPDTVITTLPNLLTSSLWFSSTGSFSFASTEAGSTFECQIDSGAFEPCTSPVTTRLRFGNHTFAVRARDASGNVDLTPATRQVVVLGLF
ncbi:MULTISPECIES: RCC1 domain-containing protein [unclassified Nocardioides]|uniref:RCC1 domain-containing protein n=1 Tax=unclassified Nocardioides TaxID=2615069 RepID=UPI0007014CC3|nr:MULTISPECIES: Ig-like domain-containing protein [unclassified Nocardioides]KRA31007.1 hypothetical protein ASD81_16045 [Nocardioides sp. Root614]KRA87628.1 hypothetical protein ASD84_16320 [Nocardioides sp. Root682]